MEIITTPDPRLREKSEKVREIDDEVRGIIADMRKLSLDWEKEHPYELSAAMAAPQIGKLKRIIIIRDDMDDKKNASFTALINPEIVKAEGKIAKDFEGCLSVPKIYGKVPRATKVRVKAKLEDGTEVRLKATDEMARTLLHEIDHLNGILFIDHIRDDAEAFYEMNEKGDLDPISPEEYEKRIRNNKELFPDD